ncbi:MAG: glutathione-disulfide reductase [Maricaulaceae bacterium]|nr:glutathione-disulfide reductase [Maricaulaceae bacterium]
MPQYDYDLFVIGAGSGGVRAARLAAQAGARVAVAEDDRAGGTCVVRGCIPKKYFVYAAEFAKSFAEAAHYGWRLSSAPQFDWPTLRDAVQAEVTRLSGIYESVLANAGAELISERASFVDAHTLRLAPSGRTVTAKHVLIATGGTPWTPDDLPGRELALVSDDAFLFDRLPARLVIAGGGYIACEFAQVFAGLGVQVTQVYRGDTVLRGFDDDIRAAAQQAIIESGVRLITGTVFERIEGTADGGRRVRLKNGEVLEADAVLMAVGRRPNVSGLGLAAAGVDQTPGGAVKVDAYSRTSAPHIYAVGDVTDRVNLTPVAIREAMAFVETVFGAAPAAFDHADVASAVFTQPPVGAVGLTEAEARERYGAVDIYKTSFRPMKGVLAQSPQRSVMKLVVKPDDGRVLGVHVFGPDAPEMIQLAAIAVKAGLTKGQFDAACAVHPTAAEELVTMRDKWTPPEMKAAE